MSSGFETLTSPRLLKRQRMRRARTRQQRARRAVYLRNGRLRRVRRTSSVVCSAHSAFALATQPRRWGKSKAPTATRLCESQHRITAADGSISSATMIAVDQQIRLSREIKADLAKRPHETHSRATLRPKQNAPQGPPPRSDAREPRDAAVDSNFPATKIAVRPKSQNDFRERITTTTRKRSHEKHNAQALAPHALHKYPLTAPEDRQTEFCHASPGNAGKVQSAADFGRLAELHTAAPLMPS